MPFARSAALTLSLLLGACATAPVAGVGVSPRLAGDAAHPAQAAGWQRTELYFGLGLVDGVDALARERQWRQFLDAEVTPRFPEGLSVIEVYGQWQHQGAAVPERLHSKMLVLLHPSSAAKESAIEAIRAAWKQATGDVSVLRVTQPAEVSF